MKEEAGRYFSVPFTLPDSVESVKLTYEYDRSVNIIDLGLADGKGELIGWSGSDCHCITVSERKSSSGFAPCTMIGGQWNILLWTYKVQESGVLVTYTADDILKALKSGNSFVTLSPDGPALEIRSHGITLKGSIPENYIPGNHFPGNSRITLNFHGLKKDDSLCLIWKDGREEIICTEASHGDRP